MTETELYTNKENAICNFLSAFQEFVDAAKEYGMDNFDIATEVCDNLELDGSDITFSFNEP
jgi:hypothetical protein